MNVWIGIILIILAFVLAIPIQMIFPFPWGLIVFFSIIIAGIITLIKSRKKGSSNIDILKSRYAKGEITKEEFDKMKEDLY